VKRYDSAPITGVQVLGSGSIRVNAALTRTGIFTYRNQDGTERKEYRPGTEVFKTDALETFKALPVTVGHPGLVTPENWRSVTVGHVGDDVRQDGELVGASLVISDQGAIEKVQRGDLKEISCGYDVDLVETPGEINGERYDAIQTNIRGNHVALGPTGWGRAGSVACIRLDGNQDAINSKEPMAEKTEVTASDVTINVTGAAEIEKLQARCDMLESENKTLKDEAAKTPAKIAEAVKARVVLESAAAKHLPEFKCDGKTDREIREAVIAKNRPGFKCDGKSEDYVTAAFEFALEAPAEGLASVRKDALNAVNSSENQTDGIEAARIKSEEKSKNAWKKPLTMSQKA
jgi:hypothetical protein